MTLPVIEDGGQLVIHGFDDTDVPLIGQAWTVTNLVAAWRMPDLVFLNRRITGGRTKTYPPLFAPTTFTLHMVIIGENDWAGLAHESRRAGLKSNLNYLFANVFGAQDPVLTGTLTDPIGDQTTGEIQFAGFPLDGYGGDTLEADISVTIPNPWQPV